MWRLTETTDWEVLRNTFDWIQDMEGVPQDAIFHGEGDVAVHTRMVVEALINLPEYAALKEQDQQILLAAALLHDVEKRSTTLIEPDGRISSRGHARRGAYTARNLIYRYHPAPFSIKEAVAKLVRYHGLPIWVFEKPNPGKALLKASLEVDTRLLTILAKADMLGRICPDQKDMLYRVQLFEEFCKEQNCFGQSPDFPTGFSQYLFFKKEEATRDYVPYEDNCFEVILLSALPGSGKDTFIRKQYPGMEVVSIDALRRKHKVSPRDKKQNGRMVQLAKEQAKVNLRAKHPFIWNATNTSLNMRAQLIDLFQSYGAKTRLIYLEVPFKQLRKQNSSREYEVPTKVLSRMINKLEVPAVWEAPVVEFLTY